VHIKRIYATAFISWMVFITLLSLVSFPGIDTPEIKIPHIDKLVHFAFYLVASILGCFFLRETTNGDLKKGKAISMVFFGCVVYGIIIEILQKELTLEREGDVMDVLANSIGAFMGAFAAKILFSGKTPLKWKI